MTDGARGRDSPRLEGDPGVAARCPQCGAAVPVRDENPFTACASCRVPLALDVGGFVLHSSGLRRLSRTDAIGTVRAHLEAAEVRDRPTSAEAELAWRPWYRVPRDAGATLVPASGAAADEIEGSGFRPSATAELVAFDPTSDGTFVPAVVSAVEAVASVQGGALRGVRLVHIPVWRVTYRVLGKDYQAEVDAASGRVFAWSLPPTATRSIDLRTGLAFAGMTLAFGLLTLAVDGFLLTIGASALLGVVFFFLLRFADRRDG